MAVQQRNTSKVAFNQDAYVLHVDQFSVPEIHHWVNQRLSVRQDVHTQNIIQLFRYIFLRVVTTLKLRLLFILLNSESHKEFNDLNSVQKIIWVFVIFFIFYIRRFENLIYFLERKLIDSRILADL
jgi:hypothetical protein